MRMILTPLALGALIAAAPLAAADPAAGAATLSTHMTGADEVPGPGAPSGSGEATISFNPAQNQLCYTLTAQGVDTPVAAHVHKGAKGVAGPAVVPLDPPTGGSSKGCATVAPATLQAIQASPADYYVNVHTAKYPQGAMRGQLGG